MKVTSIRACRTTTRTSSSASAPDGPRSSAPGRAALRVQGAGGAPAICTHHHPVTWAATTRSRATSARDVVGHASDKGRIPEQTRFVEDGDAFALGELRVRVLHIPGHTLGAVAYHVTAEGREEEGSVFTGDTLFLAGCGRLFEGTPAMMFTSLAKLAALPPRTRVFCGHEYTQSNLKFAAHVEPGNAAVAERAGRVAELRRAGTPTVPGTMADELATNPFLRVRSARSFVLAIPAGRTTRSRSHHPPPGLVSLKSSRKCVTN